MKSFDSITFNVAECRRQLKKLQRLLKKQDTLKEAKEILPFFKRNRQLAALMGTRFPNLVSSDKIAFEYDLFGDFACDVVIGNGKTLTYCFVELEDAAPKSIFRKAASKSTPEWARRFEQGFSQIVDWFWKMDEMRRAPDFADRFGAAEITVHGLLVIGRDQDLADRERRRLKWRLDKVIIDSHHVHCVTFDELSRELERQLTEYE